MAGSFGRTAGKGKRGGSKVKKRKRVGFHIDMTPLVDIIMLLLVFFLFTTTLAAPQVLDMTIPPEIDVEIEVRESELLSIFVREDDSLFWARGTEDPKSLRLNEVRDLSIRENLDPAVKNRLIVALKTSQDASYGIVVQILDELNLAEGVIAAEIAKELDEDGNPKVRERRFTIAELTAEEKLKIEGAE
jgi:biopolymer transport protein ExbD